MSVRRSLSVALLASIMLVGVVAPASGFAPKAAAAAVVPKVVIIVGPAGEATSRYRTEARKAAALARRYTPDVAELYSPDATWPAVKAALQAASLVIYMGHGNGWPSRYRDELYPPTQNGFGLNPSTGSGDSTHQYFGESFIAKHIRLADDAVVLLHHLCYASGNSEPGLPEGSLGQASQRVDNFAAGFIKAGAGAVVAEAHAGPTHMIRAVLGGSGTIERAWRTAPSRNGNAFAFQSARNPGFVAQMDPEHADSGFTRSIVLRSGLASADVLRQARGSGAAGSRGTSLGPSLTTAGIALKAPDLSATTAAAKLTYQIPYTIKDRSGLPKAMRASVRWDPLDPVAADPASAVDPTAAPDLGLVVVERIGDVVDPAKVKVAKKSISFTGRAPTEPGRFRLTITLHDGDGVAFDPATQALLPSLIVRVTGDLDAQIVAPVARELPPGASTPLSLWVANLGIAAWGHPAFVDPIDPDGSAPATAARVTGQWVALDSAADPGLLAAAAAATVKPVELPAGLESGAVVPVELRIFGPDVAGDYLLILDIVSPDIGSLIAQGVEPTIIRVRVAPAPQAAGS